MNKHLWLNIFLTSCMHFCRSTLLFFLVFTSYLSQAQDFRALRLGKYSGVNALHFNPAYHRSSDIKIDVSFGSMGLDVSNNYFRFDKTSFLGLIRDRKQLGDKIKTGVSSTDDIDSIFQIEYFDFKNTRAHVDAEINGPGFMVQLDKVSIGMFSKAKVISHMNNMPNWEDANEIGSITFGVPFELPMSDFSIASWLEVGASLSGSFEMDEYSFLHLGTNVKYYQAYDLLFVRSLRETEVTKYSDSSYYESGEFEAALFSGFNYEEQNQTACYEPSINGNGYGFDIGAVYEYKTSSYDDTSIKIGASIHDLGYIDYVDGDFHHLNLIDGFILKDKFLDEFFTTELSKDLDIDDKEYIERGNRKRIPTPATINLFAEYDLTPNLFVNVAIRENIPGISPIERSSFISAAGQYQTKWFSYTLPISLYNHQFLHLGSALRLGPLTIGSDNFLPLFLPLDLNSANIYVGLNVNSSMFDFLKGRFRKRGKRTRSKDSSRSVKKVKCYYFDQ